MHKVFAQLFTKSAFLVPQEITNNKEMNDTMLKDFATVLGGFKGLPGRTVAVAGADDGHTLEALGMARERVPIRCMLVGDESEIRRVAEEVSFSLSGCEIVSARGVDEAARLAVSLAREGDAHAIMKGRLQTADLLRAVVDKETGIRAGGVMSHVAFIESSAYHKLFVVTDAGMLTRPDLHQKVEISKNAIGFLRSMGVKTPKAAALCAVETVSSKMPETEDAQRLAKLADEGAFGDCILEGPLSFDIAMSAECAAIKRFDSKVSGDVDILIVPDIAAGNMMCKAILLLGNAKMAGCVVGAQVPVILTSRGASSEEKYLSILLALSAKR